MMFTLENRKITLRALCEGVVKFNVLLIVVCAIFFYLERLHVQEYFHFMKNQFLVITLTCLFGKCYEKIMRSIPFAQPSLYKYSIFASTFASVLCIYLYGMLTGYFVMKIELLYLLSYHLVLSAIFWMIVIMLYRSSLMSKFIALLDTCFSYKDLYKLFVIFNAIFFIVIFSIIAEASSNKNLLEVVFIVLYYEISFLVCHMVIAHCVDLVWRSPIKKTKDFSLFGICIGSMVYMLKLNIIDKKLIGATTSYDISLLASILVLILFWIFFTILFHIKEKYILKRSERSRS